MSNKVQKCVLASALAVGVLSGCCTEESLTFVHMADSQFGRSDYDADAKRYEIGIGKINEDIDNDKPEFMLMAGDMVNKATKETNQHFLDLTSVLEIPYFLVPGNHDYNNAPATIELYRESYGDDYFWFDSENGVYRFIVINTCLWKDPSDRTEAHDIWFQNALDQAKAEGKIIMVAGHCPIFEFTVDEEDSFWYNIPHGRREEVLQTFKDYGVIGYFGGHTHNRIDNEWEGIRFLHSETTSLNNDGRPRGYRVVTVKGRTITDKFVAVEQAFR